MFMWRAQYFFLSGFKLLEYVCIFRNVCLSGEYLWFKNKSLDINITLNDSELLISPAGGSAGVGQRQQPAGPDGHDARGGAVHVRGGLARGVQQEGRLRAAAGREGGRAYTGEYKHYVIV